MRLTRADIGRAFKVRFLDHSENAGTVEVTAFGELLRYSRTSMDIGAWLLQDPELAGNQTIYTIIRSTVISAARLEERKD